MCGSTVSGLKKYIKHVGRHLEQLALFALPSLEEQNATEDAASDEQISAQSSLDVSSQSSSQAGSLILQGERMSLQGEEEEVEENLSSMGDNSRTQIPNLRPPTLALPPRQFSYFELEKLLRSMTPVEFWTRRSNSPRENSGGFRRATVIATTSITQEDGEKIVENKFAWFRSRLASIVAPKMELVEGLELEARRLESTPVGGLSREDNLWICKQMVQILRRVVDELKMFPESYDFSELSQKEATRILELLNDDRRRVETKLEKLELSVANAKVRGTDHTEDLDAEDASEMSARLAGLDGDPLSGFKDEQDFIKFKDAVGRKFIFPFHIIRTWTVRTRRKKQAQHAKTNMVSGYA